MRKSILLLSIIGVLSGAISYFTTTRIPIATYSPGIVFGISLLLYFLNIRNWKIKITDFAWMLGSSGSYYVAVNVAITISRIQNHEFDTLPFFMAGLIGAALMLVSYNYFLENLNLSEYLTLTLLGGILATSINIGSNYALLTLFLVWQGGMGLALGYVLDRKGGGA